jgi:hypothetical protein
LEEAAFALPLPSDIRLDPVIQGQAGANAMQLRGITLVEPELLGSKCCGRARLGLLDISSARISLGG